MCEKFVADNAGEIQVEVPHEYNDENQAVPPNVFGILALATGLAASDLSATIERCTDMLAALPSERALAQMPRKWIRGASRETLVAVMEALKDHHQERDED
jgi:molybdopterin converting factor small subunit